MVDQQRGKTMISFTAQSDDPKVRIAIETAFVEERERLLRRIARVSRGVSAGDSYERSAFLTCRDLFGGDVVNLHTWRTVYAGSQMYPEDVAYYSQQMIDSGRPTAPWAAVVSTTLHVERERAINPPVSRETSPDVLASLIAAVPQSEPDLDTGCECNECSDVPCNGYDHESCDDHACVTCHGENYCCDDHSCDTCYSDHACCSACGYCSECGSHAGDRDESDRDLCPNCSWCRECDHDCDNY